MLESTKNQIANEVITTINALRNYAIEDTTIAKENGCMSVTGTEHGCMDITFDNGMFNCVARKNYTELTTLLSNGSQNEMIALLMTSYIIEALVASDMLTVMPAVSSAAAAFPP